MEQSRQEMTMVCRLVNRFEILLPVEWTGLIYALNVRKGERY